MTLHLTPVAERSADADTSPAARPPGPTLPSLVCQPAEVTPSRLPLVGGKGRGLVRLAGLGHDVPPWYVVTTTAFSALLAADGLAARIAARLDELPAGSTAALRQAADDIHGWILAAELPAGLATALAQTHTACFALAAGAAAKDAEDGTDGGPVAVRSSAGDEDGESASYSGLHDTLLGVRGIPAVLAAVRTVWASSCSEPALAYRRARGLPLVPSPMAVVVQQLVDARTSGVVFTADPATGNVHQVVISALHGYGEGLVGLGLPADRYRFDKAALAGRRGAASPVEPRVETAHKAEQLLPAADAPRLVRTPVAAALQDPPCLTSDQARRLARLAIAVERQLERPQDLEFAFDAAGRLWLLQTRPLTGLAEYGPAVGHRIVWDHENWAENYPGITLPLTFSVSRRQERVGYQSLAAILRMNAARLFEYQVAYDQPLGYIRGRIVTNEISRYRLMGLARGFDFNRRGILGGLSFPIDELDPEPAPVPPPLRRYLIELPKLLSLFAGLVGDFLRVHRDVEALLASARQFHARCAAMDFDAMEPHELLAVYTEVETRLIMKWKAPLLNVLFLRLLWLLLKRLCKVWCRDTTGSLQNDLLRGDRGSESARPVKLMLRMACAVHRDPALTELFARHLPSELPALIAADPAHADFASQVQSYLATYHYQSPYEMKLESATLRDQPEQLYQKIRSYVAQGDAASLDPDRREQQEDEVRRDAERRAEAGMRRGLLFLPRRAFFRWLVDKERRLDAQREDIKFLRLRLMGLFRELLRALGRRLAASRALAAPDDIYYLTLEELLDYVRGSAVTVDLAALAALRRKELASYAELPLGDRFETFGTVYEHNLYRERATGAAAPAHGDLRGTGCCSGTVSGLVRVLTSPTEVDHLDGEILVLERIHTGWFSLLPFVSGLLVERGEILSHATTVARELGIPTIVGIPGLLARVRSGQRVTLDGEAGTIRLLSELAA